MRFVPHRTLRGLSLDDLTAITRAHIHPQASRAALGRLLKREGVSRLADLIPAGEGDVAPKKPFKDYAPGTSTLISRNCRGRRTKRITPICASPSTVPADGATSRFCPIRPPRDAGFPGAPGRRVSVQDRENPDRQRQGIHRPVHRPRRTRTDRTPLLRSSVPQTRRRAPPDPAGPSADQRHGGALQRPHRRPTPKYPLPERRRTLRRLGTLSPTL